jgi:hypothetical protein
VRCWGKDPEESGDDKGSAVTDGKRSECEDTVSSGENLALLTSDQNAQFYSAPPLCSTRISVSPASHLILSMASRRPASLMEIYIIRFRTSICSASELLTAGR